ncbi:hypothetical protein [Tahibacter aquaticus]|uniref:hypothetical protein n=1 Tax=Tahibacter aquaticus TaxID=520092 RepID=UPI0010621154|nr:hypothetical protein [Tahibacter aquaticus]
MTSSCEDWPAVDSAAVASEDDGCFIRCNEAYRRIFAVNVDQSMGDWVAAKMRSMTQHSHSPKRARTVAGERTERWRSAQRARHALLRFCCHKNK